MIDRVLKMRIKKKWFNSENIYLPNPGIPLDLEIEVGDYVVIDLKAANDFNKTYSYDMDMQTTEAKMFAQNGKTLKVKKILDKRKTNPIHNYCYRLEGVDFYWSWYHFATVYRKGSFLVDKAKPTLPNI